MATVKRMHVGEYGTVFKVTVKERNETTEELEVVNVNGMTEAKVRFEKGEDGTVIERDLSFLTDGTDGVLVYTFQPGDLDTEGRWSWQMYVILSSGKWYSLKDIFYVDEPYTPTV